MFIFMHCNYLCLVCVCESLMVSNSQKYYLFLTVPNVNTFCPQYQIKLQNTIKNIWINVYFWKDFLIDSLLYSSIISLGDHYISHFNWFSFSLSISDSAFYRLALCNLSWRFCLQKLHTLPQQSTLILPTNPSKTRDVDCLAFLS